MLDAVWRGLTALAATSAAHLAILVWHRSGPDSYAAFFPTSFAGGVAFLVVVLVLPDDLLAAEFFFGTDFFDPR